MTGSAPRVYLQSLDGSVARAVTPEGFVLARDAVSLDGKSFIARRESDRQWVVFPISGGQPRPVPGAVAADLPMQWTADGHSIYVYQFGMPADRAGFGGFDLAAIIPDGKTIVYSYSRILTNLYLMQGAR
ncbi:MAG: TolB-like translocation protein [Candidatus Acidiferrales bacterium]